MKQLKLLAFLLFFGILMTSFVIAHEDDPVVNAITGFATDNSTTTSSGVSGKTTALIVIDVLGIIIGFMLLTFLLTSLEPFRGPLRTSYMFMGFGIFFQVCALIYTVVFVRLKLLGVPFGLDIHHLLMTVGIVFFSFAVYNLREVVKGASNA